MPKSAQAQAWKGLRCCREGAVINFKTTIAEQYYLNACELSRGKFAGKVDELLRYSSGQMKARPTKSAQAVPKPREPVLRGRPAGRPYKAASTRRGPLSFARRARSFAALRMTEGGSMLRPYNEARRLSRSLGSLRHGADTSVRPYKAAAGVQKRTDSLTLSHGGRL